MLRWMLCSVVSFVGAIEDVAMPTCSNRVVACGVTTHGLLYDFVCCKVHSVRRALNLSENVQTLVISAYLTCAEHDTGDTPPQ